MKKVIFLFISVIFTTITLSAQSKILKKGSLLPTSPKQSIDFIRQGTINKDSILSKKSNGFDVKKSQIDNMVYLNTNEDNPALNKMPIGIPNPPFEPMPVAQLPTITNSPLKDTSFKITFNSDFLKRLKKN